MALVNGIEYTIDPADSLTIKALLDAPHAVDWEPVGHNAGNFGFDARAYWYRLSLQVAPDVPPLLLKVDNPLLDHLDVYVVRDGMLLETYHTGDMEAFQQRPIKNRTYLFPLDARGQRVELYFRVKTDSPQRLPLTLWDPAEFDQQDRIVLMGHSFYFGIVFVMIIYNLAMFFSVRDFNYLVYVASVAAFALFDASMNGYTFQYLWPNAVQWNDKAPMMLLNLFILARGFFIYNFLNLRAHNTLMARLHLGFVALGFLSLLSVFIAPISVAITIGLTLGFIGLIVGQVEGVIRWIMGLTHARFFVIGWSAFMSCLLINLLAQVGLLPINTFTLLATQFGSSIEIILFTFALADRVRLLQQERNQLELQKKDALLVANRSLEESLRVKDEFLATISHELRTPMNGVIASLDSIQASDDLDEIKRHSNTGYQSAQEMMGLVEGILGYTEMQSGQFELEPVEFSLRKLCEKLHRDFQSRADSRGLHLNLDVDDDLPDRLMGDARRLSQILGCLIDNAIKFTHQGYVTVAVRATTAAAAGRERILLRFCVTDSGIGVADTERDRIFEKFHQVDGSYHRSYGGLGLGLAISQTLVAAMGGTLHYAPGTREGSQFIVTLAFGCLPERREHRDLLTASLPIPAARILLAEDNNINQMVMKAMLEKLGVEVLLAENGAEAVTRAQTEPLDLILMDLQMPVMDGFDATERIRALDNPVAKVPIIAVTANVMDADRRRCRECGMDDFVGKPVNREKLNEIFSKWLRSSHTVAAPG